MEFTGRAIKAELIVYPTCMISVTRLWKVRGVIEIGIIYNSRYYTQKILFAKISGQPYSTVYGVTPDIFGSIHLTVLKPSLRMPCHQCLEKRGTRIRCSRSLRTSVLEITSFCDQGYLAHHQLLLPSFSSVDRYSAPGLLAALFSSARLS